eukprot:1293173-Rhodomonas_salina.1
MPVLENLTPLPGRDNTRRPRNDASSAAYLGALSPREKPRKDSSSAASSFSGALNPSSSSAGVDDSPVSYTSDPWTEKTLPFQDPATQGTEEEQEERGKGEKRDSGFIARKLSQAVSYTHLTLPTICSV